MARTEFMAALNQVAAERGIDPAIIIETLQHAMLAAYRRDFGEREGISADINSETGEVKILDEKGKDITPAGFGRIAAQTAKQVILQGVIVAEKEAILEEYKKKVGQILPAMLQRRDGDNWVVDIGRATALMPLEEQVTSESYRQNQRLRVYFKEIAEVRGKQELIVSRVDDRLLLGLFDMEIPEVATHAVEIKGIAREAGYRSKVAVTSTQEKVDPIGSCVGQKGVRVQAITSELSGEKIDLILWSPDVEKYVSASLSPAKALGIKLNEKKKEAKVKVDEEQLSLAIGKDGQNVRLAARLTGYRIDIEGIKIKKEEKEELAEPAEGKSDETQPVVEDKAVDSPVSTPPSQVDNTNDNQATSQNTDQNEVKEEQKKE